METTAAVTSRDSKKGKNFASQTTNLFSELAMALRRTMSPVKTPATPQEAKVAPEAAELTGLTPDSKVISANCNQSFDERSLMGNKRQTEKPQAARCNTMAVINLTKLQKLRAMTPIICDEDEEPPQEPPKPVPQPWNSKVLVGDSLIIEDKDEEIKSTLSPSRSFNSLTGDRAGAAAAATQSKHPENDLKRPLGRTRSGGVGRTNQEPDIHPELTVDQLRKDKHRLKQRNVALGSQGTSKTRQRQSSEMLEINTMFDFEPELKPRSRQRRMSTMGNFMQNTTLNKSMAGRRRRSSITTLAGPIRKQELTQQKFLNRRMYMANEGKIQTEGVGALLNELQADSDPSSPRLQMPQSRSAVHYLAISPPRIRVTDESNPAPNTPNTSKSLSNPELSCLESKSSDLDSDKPVTTDSKNGTFSDLSQCNLEDIDEDYRRLRESPMTEDTVRADSSSKDTDESIAQTVTRRRSSNLSASYYYRRQGSTTSTSSSCIINHSSSSSSSSSSGPLSRGGSESRRSSTDTWNTSSKCSIFSAVNSTRSR